MPVDPLIKGATDLVSTGFLGTVVVALAFVVIYLWRENKAQRNQYDSDLEEERVRNAREMSDVRNKYDVEMAEQRKLNSQQQEARLVELKAAMNDVVKVTGTLEQALTIVHGGGR